VVTPWLSQLALDESGLVPALSAAVARGIALTVYTDRIFNAQRGAHDESAFDSLASALETLREVGADLIEVCGVHSKILMADEDLFCTGRSTGSVLHGMVRTRAMRRRWPTAARRWPRKSKQ
jgi:hypothetical protein